MTKGPRHHVHMCSGDNNAIFTQLSVMLVLLLDRLKKIVQIRRGKSWLETSIHPGCIVEFPSFLSSSQPNWVLNAVADDR